MLTANLRAQDGSGRSETAAGSAATASSKKRARTRAPRAARRPSPPVPAAATVETGRLAVFVNEGGSQIQISRAGGESGTEMIAATSKARSLIQRTLPAGRYELLVKKAGFFDEARTVDIVGGKRRRAEINLRPMMARISIIANVPDARIDVERIGSYDGAVRKMFVKPGTYRINVRRRGYQSFKSSVDLKIAGQEKVVNVVLKPIRIDTILAQAADNISRGRYDAAADQTNDVLLLNAEHAKANLIYGLIEYYRHLPTAASYMMKAVRKGETVTLPVKILEEGSSKLVEADLLLNRDGVGLRSRAKFDLNYTLAAHDISGLRSEAGGNAVAFIALEGRSNFHGRVIQPHLKIYSREAFLQAGERSPSCMNSTTSRSCNSAADIIYKLLSDWRSAPKEFARQP